MTGTNNKGMERMITLINEAQFLITKRVTALSSNFLSLSLKDSTVLHAVFLKQNTRY